MEEKKQRKETFTKKELLKSINTFCRNCQGIEKGQPTDPIKDCMENEKSQYGECPLWKYRMGKKI